jgi:hypothetical protein
MLHCAARDLGGTSFLAEGFDTFHRLRLGSCDSESRRLVRWVVSGFWVY